MKELTSNEKLIVAEWKKRQAQHEEAKKILKDTLGRYGIASVEFKTARIEFEMLKEEFDNFEKEHHKIVADYR